MLSNGVVLILVLSRSLIIIIVALGLSGWSARAQAPPRRVLLLYPFDNAHPASVNAGASVKKRLLDRSPSKIDIVGEFLDLARFPREADELRTARYLADKHTGAPPDIIMPLNSEALRFATKYREMIAPNVPIVFCCVTPDRATAPDRPKDITGVYSQFDVGKTIALARQLQPEARNLVVVSGPSEIDRRWLEALRKDIEPYQNLLKTEFWVGVPYKSLLERASHLPRETIIVFVTDYDNSTGEPLVPAQVVEALAQAASAPVYGPSDTYLGLGVVGGYMDSFELMGLGAADVALEVLAGRNPGSIAPQVSANRRFQVDARQLLRWELSEKNLPADTVLSFKEPSLWEEHRNLVVVTVFVFLLQAILISALLFEMFARRRAEASLRESENRWRSVFEMSTVGVALADQNFRFLSTNAAFQTLFGRTDEELRGRTPLDLGADEEREAFTLLYERIRAGRQQSYDTVRQYRHKDGTPIWAHVYVSKIRSSEAKPPLLLATTIDITDRKRAEAASRDALSELARVARLTTMGEMTASIAHEINQPLGSIVNDGSAGLRWLANASPDLEEARACFRRIVNDGHRAGQVITGIRGMLKKTVGIKETLNINELAREVLMFARGEIENQKIEVQTELKENLSAVLVDRIQLQQVVLNLVMNGIDTLATVRGRARVLKLRSEQTGIMSVTLTVEDTGAGVDNGIIGRIFEAFFTTKQNGMGLGLSICRSIIVAHGGQLSVSPAHPHGSAFHIELPACQPGTARS
jgi:PAS domain S-box-containing protein